MQSFCKNAKFYHPVVHFQKQNNCISRMKFVKRKIPVVNFFPPSRMALKIFQLASLVFEIKISKVCHFRKKSEFLGHSPFSGAKKIYF